MTAYERAYGSTGVEERFHLFVSAWDVRPSALSRQQQDMKRDKHYTCIHQYGCVGSTYTAVNKQKSASLRGGVKSVQCHTFECSFSGSWFYYLSHIVSMLQHLYSPPLSERSVWVPVALRPAPSKKSPAPLIGQLFQAWAGTAHRVAAVLKVRSNSFLKISSVHFSADWVFWHLYSKEMLLSIICIERLQSKLFEKE